MDWDVACCVVFPPSISPDQTFFRATLNKSQHNLCFVLTQALKWAKSLSFTLAINVHLLMYVSSPIKRQRDRSSDIFYYGLWLISNLLLSAYVIAGDIQVFIYFIISSHDFIRSVTIVVF